jgi:hypothetical protein
MVMFGAEFIAFIIMSIIGYLVGGTVGILSYNEWSPYCWYGLFIVWGAMAGCICIGEFDLD